MALELSNFLCCLPLKTGFRVIGFICVAMFLLGLIFSITYAVDGIHINLAVALLGLCSIFPALAYMKAEKEGGLNNKL